MNGDYGTAVAGCRNEEGTGNPERARLTAIRITGTFGVPAPGNLFP
jgi:hypothetical protein